MSFTIDFVKLQSTVQGGEINKVGHKQKVRNLDVDSF